MPEQRVVLKNCGVIDPRNIDTYLAHEGYQALDKAWSTTPQQVIQIIKDSNLRGRGGAGFPVGLKLDLASKTPASERYVLCNADEGEVGTFKDRYILQGDPFSLIEGIAIAGYAIGSKKGYIYLRTEYHSLRLILDNALAQAREKWLIGEKAKYPFEIEVYEGAGAYVCGEESALMESIEGRRGESRYKPPFPPNQGLFAKPTIINNVETLMNLPRVILNGAEWFNKIGTEKSKGTKVFSVSGDVARPAVYELPLGASLRELVETLAGAKNVKMVQIGGASGRVLPAARLDTPLTFETVLGAGAVIIFNETRDVIDIVHKTMDFFVDESCGKCTPCRQGTEALLETMERFYHGQGSQDDIKNMQDLSRVMMSSSLCGLGQAAPNAVIDTLQYFPEAYEARITA